MKTTNVIKAIFIILLAGTIFSMNAYGRKPVNETKYPNHAKQIRNLLEQTVKFPDCGMTIKGQGIVEVVFSIGSDGKVDIHSVTANCKELDVYVKEQLAGVSFAGVKHPEDQHYRATFIFYYS